MKRFILTIFCIFLISFPKAHADLFGGDVAVLTQILANAIKQLTELKSIVDASEGNLELLREINRGINDAMQMIETISPYIDPGLYRELQKISDAIRHIEGIYGVVAPSKEYKVQSDTDHIAAEAITLNTNIYKYAELIDDIGEQIKSYSKVASPGGAQKLTAQSLGVLLHVQNESLRAQATGLKLQAQSLAVQNKKDKEKTKHIIAISNELEKSINDNPPQFKLPRF